MFIDEVKIHAKAGKGGNGIVHWHRSKETARGGPDGGDGGRGGDVALVGVRDYSALFNYRHKKKFRAENGEAGRGALEHGKDGEALLLPVPIGTVARLDSGLRLAKAGSGHAEAGDEYEVLTEGEPIVILKGGTGGKGNARFKSSTHQNPFEHTDGREGKEADISLTLKIIADAGLIGLPNAGKSSLLNALTRAKSKVGNYAFTTLEPNLGDLYGHIIADIPGIIEGASSGRGLGIKFLKHIERTGVLLHLVSADQDDPLSAYREVRSELEAFGSALARKPEIIILSKIDLVDAALRETKMELLREDTEREVVGVSILEPRSLKTLSDKLTKILS